MAACRVFELRFSLGDGAPTKAQLLKVFSACLSCIIIASAIARLRTGLAKKRLGRDLPGCGVGRLVTGRRRVEGGCSP